MGREPNSPIVWSDGMRTLKHFALITVVIGVSGVPCVKADTSVSSTPWAKACRAYSSGRQFAQDSAKYCLRHAEQKDCSQRAAAFFEKCRFDGDYEKISARARARMLLVIALSSIRPVRHLDL